MGPFTRAIHIHVTDTEIERNDKCQLAKFLGFSKKFQNMYNFQGTELTFFKFIQK